MRGHDGLGYLCVDFFPVPEPSSNGAAFMQALENAGYVMPAVYGAQVVCGLLLLTRRFVPLALLLLSPVIANILLYDVFLNHGGLVIGTVIALIYAAILYNKRGSFMPLLQP